MPHRTMPYERIDWPFPWAGVQSELDPQQIPPVFLKEADNLYYPSAGIMRTRGGIDLAYHNALAAGDIRTFFSWAHDDHLYWGDEADHLFRNNTNVPGVAENVTSIVAYGYPDEDEDPVLFVCEEQGGEDHSIHTWDGTTYAQLMGTEVPDDVTHLMIRFGRLWAFKQGGDYVYYSEAGHPPNFGGNFGEGGSFPVFPGIDGTLQDWCVYRNNLYLFKERAIYVLVGDQPVNWGLRYFEACDTPIPGTICDCTMGTLFCTARGVYVLGRGYRGESHNLLRFVQQAVQPHLLTARAAYVRQLGVYIVVLDEREMWVSNVDNRPDVWTRWYVPGNPDPEPKEASPSPFPSGGVLDFSGIYDGDRLYFGTSAGNVYAYDPAGLTDEGAPFYPRFTTGHWHMGSLLREKNIRFVEGRMNGADAATTRVRLFADGAAVPVVDRTLDADEDLMQVNFGCQRLGMQVLYTNLTGPAYLGDIALHVVPWGDVE